MPVVDDDIDVEVAPGDDCGDDGGDDSGDDGGDDGAGDGDAGDGGAVVSNTNIEADADNAEGKINLGIVLAKCPICSSSLVLMFSQIHP